MAFNIVPFLGPIATVASSLFSAKSAEKTNKANIDQAQADRDFQERMSNTAHQREVTDLKAAGLNPILSANHGASTPGGAMATLQNPYARLADDVNSASKSYMEMKMNRELVESERKKQANLDASTDSMRAEADLKRENAVLARTNNIIARNAAKSSAYDLSQRKRMADIENSKYGQALNWAGYTIDKVSPAVATALGFGVGNRLGAAGSTSAKQAVRKTTYYYDN